MVQRMPAVRAGKIGLRKKIREQRILLLFILPGFLCFFVFCYLPFFGIVMAFQNYNPVAGVLGSPFVGFENFRSLLYLPSFTRALKNTLAISALKILFCFPAPILFALMLNEIRCMPFKRVTQTISYLPHFISWVVAAGLWYEALSPSGGFVNLLLLRLGILREPVNFMGRADLFYPILISSEIWKELGWGAIIYLAAITTINPELYEASYMDGANKLQQILHITLPSIKSTIVLLFILALSNVLNAGFDQLQNMQNIVVMEVGDILDTLILRTLTVGGIRDMSYGAAMGIMKSVVGMLLFVSLNKFSKLAFDEYLV